MTRLSKVLGMTIAACVGIAACDKTSQPPRSTPPVGDVGPRSDAAVEKEPLVATTPALVPRPRSMKSCAGTFVVDRTTRIAVEDAPEGRAVGERLARWLGLAPSSIDVVPSGAADPRSGVVLRLSTSGATRRDPAVTPPRSTDEEAYALDVSSQRAVVRAAQPAGLFYGAQTLAQLAGARRIGVETPVLTADRSYRIGCVTIEDAPRFPFRGMHLDVARHFFSKEVVERYVDLLTFYRFNVFHWHLTDDQGFRFAVKSRPELTEIGGRDGFYTQDEARAVVAYARERSVTVVPEVDTPGHTRAILAAHPEVSCTGKKQEVPKTWGVFEDVLCVGNEKTYELLGDIFGELAAVFPSQLVHIGGDEVLSGKKRWSACPKCRAAMAKAKVDVSALEGVFLQRIAGMLAKHGRRPLAWDEALEGEPSSDTVIVAWRGKERGREATARAHDVVMAPYQSVYFNVRQSKVKGEPGQLGYLPWPKVRVFDPVPEGLEPARAANVLGAEGALWTEFVKTQDDIDTLVMPRMAALAEALWSGPASAEDDFVARLNAQLPMLDASGVKYFVEPPTGVVERKVITGTESVTVAPAPPRIFPQGIVRWTKDGSDPTASSPVFDRPFTTQAPGTIAAALFLPGGRQSATLRSSVVKEDPRPARTVTTPEPGARFLYTEGLHYSLPDFTKYPVKARGRVPSIGLAELGQALGGKLRDEQFAALFEGFVRVPADGVYRFVALADDGVRLEIDGEMLFEDDGTHEARESAAEIALQGGFHAIRLAYFQESERKALTLKVEGPGLPLGPLDLVSDASKPEEKPKGPSPAAKGAP